MATFLIKGAAALNLVPEALGFNYPVIRFAAFTVGGLFSALRFIVLRLGIVHRRSG